MKVVLDTNILVSGFFPKKSSSSVILDLVLDGTLEVCCNAYILSEYREVLLRPKFNFNKEHVDIILSYIRHSGHLVSIYPLDISLPDKDDEIFIETAIIGKADYLVTGNTKHYPKKECKDVNVVSPADFIKIIKVSPCKYP